jgi:hypothetical protein
MMRGRLWNGNACDYSSNFPAMTTIGANGSAISSYLDSLGSAIAHSPRSSVIRPRDRDEFGAPVP